MQPLASRAFQNMESQSFLVCDLPHRESSRRSQGQSGPLFYTLISNGGYHSSIPALDCIMGLLNGRLEMCM